MPTSDREPRARAGAAAAAQRRRRRDERSGTPARDSTSSHSTESSAATSASTKYEPKPTAATSASTMLRRWPAAALGVVVLLARGQHDADDRHHEPDATTSDGRSPVAIPTTTGSATPVDAIGATMLIVPIASAR